MSAAKLAELSARAARVRKQFVTRNFFIKFVSPSQNIVVGMRRDQFQSGAGRRFGAIVEGR
jgi:hypothetical protein